MADEWQFRVTTIAGGSHIYPQKTRNEAVALFHSVADNLDRSSEDMPVFVRLPVSPLAGYVVLRVADIARLTLEPVGDEAEDA